jgi:hypothetical protein
MECLDVCSLTPIHLTVTAPSYFLNAVLNVKTKKKKNPRSPYIPHHHFLRTPLLPTNNDQ